MYGEGSVRVEAFLTDITLATNYIDFIEKANEEQISVVFE